MSDNKPMENEKIFISVKEAAAYLGLGIQFTYRLVQRKDFPARKYDGKWRVYKPLLMAWAEKEIASQKGDDWKDWIA